MAGFPSGFRNYGLNWSWRGDPGFRNRFLCQTFYIIKTIRYDESGWVLVPLSCWRSLSVVGGKLCQGSVQHNDKMTVNVAFHVQVKFRTVACQTFASWRAVGKLGNTPP